MSIKVILAPSADLASTINADVTVEAEYGTVVAEGTVYTAAHHQPGMENHPAPCNDPDIPALEDGIVLVSHVDLDTFGGCLRAAGVTSLFNDAFQGFWNLAEFVDLNGPHKLGESGATPENILRLHAFWAWKEKVVPRFDTSRTHDVTSYVYQAGDALAFILTGDEAHLEAGRTMMARTQELNVGTFETVWSGGVVVRVTNDAHGFCNHLYDTPEGDAHAAVAAYNKDGGSITISLADTVEGVSCRDIMQGLFGPEAGGHEGIAGSPREQRMTEEDFDRACDALGTALQAAGAVGGADLNP